ncbi:MAG: hypothetical protein AB7O24_05325 [Kofleriaceae bacterium]
MQRALAHAYLHRDQPMTTLRSSLGFMVGTASITSEPTIGRSAAGTMPPQTASRAAEMTVVGVSHAEAAAYVVEEVRDQEVPIVYRLGLRGPRQGYLVPIHAWYQQSGDAAEIRARLAAIVATLEPVTRSTTEAWMLSTRIVQRRALRVGAPSACDELPIRKFALQLDVEPVSGHGPSGRTTATAFLRPHAQLVDVWTIPHSEFAIARIAFTGVPSGVGLSKDAVVLLSTDG